MTTEATEAIHLLQVPPQQRWWRKRADLWLLALPMAFFALVLVMPLVLVVYTAVTQVGVQGAGEVISNPVFHTALLRTLLLSLIVTACCWLLGTVYSIATAVSGPRLRLFFIGTLLISFVVSLLARTYGWVVLFQPRGILFEIGQGLGLTDQPLGLLQTEIAMYPAMVHIMLPYMVLPMYSALRSVDATQLAAAQSMGAKPFTTLRRVIFPQIVNGTAAGVVLVFILSLGFFVTPALLGGPRNLTLSTLIDQQFRRLFDFGGAAVMGLALLVVVLGMMIAAEKIFGLSRSLKSLL